MSSIKLFIDGELKNDMTVSLPFLANGSMNVHSNASEGNVLYVNFTVSFAVFSCHGSNSS